MKPEKKITIQKDRKQRGWEKTLISGIKIFNLKV
jgi:translation initiation factor 1 (eIF-1/SUI1)